MLGSFTLQTPTLVILIGVIGAASATNSRGGLLLEVGGEYAITPNWTVKIEYDHIGLGTWTSAASPIVGDTISAKRQVDMVTGGLNYKFQGPLM